MSEAGQMRFRVDGMDCASCATKIETAVRRMPGVEDVSVSVTAGTLAVTHDGNGDGEAIARKVRGLGYSVSAAAARPATAAGAKTAHVHGPDCSHDDHDHAAHDHDAHDHGDQADAASPCMATTTARRMARGMRAARAA